jgi:hypothetical protein
VITTLALLVANTAEAQGNSCSIALSGDVPSPRTVTSADLAKLPPASIRASDHGQPEATYEGTRVADVLALAGLQLNLRGPGLMRYAVASASDGYRVLYTLSEFDSGFVATPAIVAWKKNGVALDTVAGPCRIVVADQKRPARWIRMLTGIEIGKVNY